MTESTRHHDPEGLRVIPATEKHPGLVAMRVDEHRERVIVGGDQDEARRVLLEGRP